MPRKHQTLTIEQIDEILNDRASEATINALKSFLRSEKMRRISAGVSGGKPRKYSGDQTERNRQSVKAWRERKKKLESK